MSESHSPNVPSPSKSQSSIKVLDAPPKHLLQSSKSSSLSDAGYYVLEGEDKNLVYHLDPLLGCGFGMRNAQSLQDALMGVAKKKDKVAATRREKAKARFEARRKKLMASAQEKIDDQEPKSMLVTGFGLRNLSSLQRALLEDEERRKRLEEKYALERESEVECDAITNWSSTLSSSMSSGPPVSEKVEPSLHQLQLEYLMGIGPAVEEEHEEAPKKPEVGEEEEPDQGRTIAMRRAQKYLRSHRIFEFFQFLIAHMLSALPENPIKFLVELLDNCLLYRSGVGSPPLLYEKKHLVELFYLMDRMRTGFVEPEQYKTGMVTLGICSYNKRPPLSPDGMVAEDTFVEEAYDCLTDIFHDMIRARGGVGREPSLMTPPPSVISTVSSGKQ